VPPGTMTADRYWTTAFPQSEADAPLRFSVRKRDEGIPWVIRRDLLDQLGGFDDRYVFAFFEDTDLWARMILAGYEPVIVHNLPTYHHLHVSCFRLGDKGGEHWVERNQERFQAIWGGWKLDQLDLPPCPLLGDPAVVE
jgi:GT2 family glycosyltransferase